MFWLIGDLTGCGSLTSTGSNHWANECYSGLIQHYILYPDSILKYNFNYIYCLQACAQQARQNSSECVSKEGDIEHFVNFISTPGMGCRLLVISLDYYLCPARYIKRADS